MEDWIKLAAIPIWFMALGVLMFGELAVAVYMLIAMWIFVASCIIIPIAAIICAIAHWLF